MSKNARKFVALAVAIAVIAALAFAFLYFYKFENLRDRFLPAGAIKTKLLIIGSGPAGYTAAIYAARANLNPILVQGMQPGGQLTITKDVENYPGFAKTVIGRQLMEQMRLQAEHVGTTLEKGQIVKVDFSKRPFLCETRSKKVYGADAVIIATGAQAQWLNIPSEKKFQGSGVSGCAICDGFFFQNKKVIVVGGGNSAVTEALFLANLASEVILVHRRDKLRAEQVLQKRLQKQSKIKIIWDSAVDEILGDTNVKGVRLKNVKTGAISELKTDAVFVAIGHKPTTALFKDQLKMDKEGYIKCEPGTTQTSVPGVFAAGDVQDKKYRQAVTAAGQGCMAALDAEKFLE
jgi:thioredoxin reductase (NADPH)